MKTPQLPKRLLLTAAAMLVSGTANASHTWNGAVVAGDFNATGSGIWSDSTFWGGANPNTMTAGSAVVIDNAVTINVDGNFTIGSLDSRSNNVDLSFSGVGTLTFDNNGAGSFWNLHSKTTRFEALRAGFTNNIHLADDLIIRTGSRRRDGTIAGRLGGLISGSGHLTLELSSHDLPTVWDLGFFGGNTYTGGTTIMFHSGGANGTGVQLAAQSTGAFGTGNVTIDGTGTGATNMQITFGANEVMGNNAVLTLITPPSGNGFINLGAFNTTLYNVTVFGGSSIGMAGVWTAAELNSMLSISSFTGSGTLTTLVPEPGTMGLGLLGSTLLLLRRKRA